VERARNEHRALDPNAGRCSKLVDEPPFVGELLIQTTGLPTFRWLRHVTVLRWPTMSPRRRETFEPVTLDQIRVHGCRDLLVYCSSVWCNHSATLNADWLPRDTPLRALCPRMVCTACGLIGADVRPDWSPHTNRPPQNANS
jgi:hypothetical protein